MSNDNPPCLVCNKPTFYIDKGWAHIDVLEESINYTHEAKPFPDPSEAYYVRWYAQPNDLIGGWCVMPVDLPPSSGCWQVADFIGGQEMAEYVAELHNRRVEEAT